MNRVYIKNLQKIMPVNRALLNRIVHTVCTQEKPGYAYQIVVCLLRDAAIRDLNRRFHHRDTPTDVLAFPLQETAKEIFADIFVSTETAIAQSVAYKTKPRYEMYLYVIHGLLHLAGFNDRTAADRRVMRRLEKKYLQIFNIA